MLLNGVSPSFAGDIQKVTEIVLKLRKKGGSYSIFDI
jgi:hypothetical protein